MTDKELELIEQALHQSVTKRTTPDIRHQAFGFFQIMYCHHSQQCFVWQTTPDDMAPWDEETLNAVLKIQDKIYPDYGDRCYRISVQMNIHSKEITQRLRWHQDIFDDELIDLLFTIVLSTPNNEQSLNQEVELGLVHAQEDVSADGGTYKFLVEAAKGRAKIDAQGRIQWLSKQRDEIFNRENRHAKKPFIKQEGTVYLMESVAEKRGTGYYINQRKVYTAAGEKFKIVHSASPIKKPESSVSVKEPIPGVISTNSGNTVESQKSPLTCSSSDTASAPKKQENIESSAIRENRASTSTGYDANQGNDLKPEATPAEIAKYYMDAENSLRKVMVMRVKFLNYDTKLEPEEQ